MARIPRVDVAGSFAAASRLRGVRDHLAYEFVIALGQAESHRVDEESSDIVGAGVVLSGLGKKRTDIAPSKLGEGGSSQP
jgi:hypothetical protein